MTNAELSIVVPVLNEADCLPRLLAQVSRWARRVEVIIVDGGSTDGSADLAHSYPGVHWLNAGLGRASQMNAGAKLATAPNILFLHADTLLPANALQLITAALAEPLTIAGSFRLCFEPDSVLLRFYSRCSSINSLITTFGDQGLFLRRASFWELGGFAALPFLEDIEIQQRLRRKGRFVKLPAAVTTSSRRFQQQGVLRQQLRNIAIVAAYLVGIRPENLKVFY